MIAAIMIENQFMNSNKMFLNVLWCLSIFNNQAQYPENVHFTNLDDLCASRGDRVKVVQTTKSTKGTRNQTLNQTRNEARWIPLCGSNCPTGSLRAVAGHTTSPTPFTSRPPQFFWALLSCSFGWKHTFSRYFLFPIHKSLYLFLLG